MRKGGREIASGGARGRKKKKPWRASRADKSATKCSEKGGEKSGYRRKKQSGSEKTRPMPFIRRISPASASADLGSALGYGGTARLGGGGDARLGGILCKREASLLGKGVEACWERKSLSSP